MEAIDMATLSRYCDGRLLQGTPNGQVRGVSTDTRSLAEGDAFVALKGERFNGHDFIEQAAAGGAGALIVSELPEASEKQAWGDPPFACATRSSPCPNSATAGSRSGARRRPVCGALW